MNQNFAGALLLFVLAQAGFQTDRPAAWWLVCATAALAFLAEEFRHAHDMTTNPAYGIARIGLAILSWLTVAAAAYSLI